MWRAALAADRPSVRRRTPSPEAVGENWADEGAREGELEKWVADAAQVVSRLREVIAGRDTLVLQVAAERWLCVRRGGARLLGGYAAPMASLWEGSRENECELLD